MARGGDFENRAENSQSLKESQAQAQKIIADRNAMLAAQAAEAERQKQSALEREGEKLRSKFTMSGEQQREMERLKLKSEGSNLMADQIAAQQQKESEQRIRSMSTMRGYDPAAARAAGRSASLASTNIQNQARVQAEQEKAQALYDYNAMVQYKNQIAYAGEQAKKAWLLGQGDLAQKQEESLLSYQSALNEINARAALAEKQRSAQIMSAIVSSVATIGATAATGNPLAGAAAGAATNAFIQGTQR